LAVYAAELEKNRPDVVGFGLETIMKLVISVLNRVIAKRLFPLQCLGEKTVEIGLQEITEGDRVCMIFS
jgi:hypothetical protein